MTAYQNYPDVVMDPVAEFIVYINQIGKLLSEDHKLIVFAELPTAFKMTSVLYAPLARDPNMVPF